MENAQYTYDFNNFKASSHMEVFRKGLDQRRFTKHYSTGIKKLDDVMNGGFEIGLGILNGVSSAGKTTLLNQIAYNMSKNDTPVIIFSLEMEVNAILSKIISMKTFLDSDAPFTASEILSEDLISQRDPKDIKTYEEIVANTINDLGNLIVVDRNTMGKAISVDEVISFTDNYIEQTGKKPVVFIDYLQRLAPSKKIDKKSTKMDIIDYSCTTLWDYSHQKQLCLVAISSLNRASYKEGATLEGNKGSGNIEYNADFALGIQFKDFDKSNFNFNVAKSQAVRDLEIVILKQRMGSGGITIPSVFHAAYNTFLFNENECENKDEVVKHQIEKKEKPVKEEITEKEKEKDIDIPNDWDILPMEDPFTYSEENTQTKSPEKEEEIDFSFVF